MSPIKQRLGYCSVFFFLIPISGFATAQDALETASDREVLESKILESEILFTRRIAPLLREKCLGCHGKQPDELEGGFDIRSRETMFAGGDSELPGIVPGKPDSSSVYLAAARGEDSFSAMPPKEAEKLTQTQLTWLRDWIKSGAQWPSKQRQEKILAKYSERWSVEDGVSVKTSGGLSPEWTDRKYEPAGLWAYQPVQKIDVPSSEQNPIDILIEEALPAGLKVAAPASRQELIRRATFDLTGLPPTPEEVSAFLHDTRSDDRAFAAVVDRLLSSPHYGEKMAQHWLDVVRYADSSGFANDFERGNAWRYRDYVVRSFNDDKRYDQFVIEQIAGDELTPESPEGLIAVGFLRMGPWELTAMEVARVARQRFLDDVTNSVGETFLGHSLQCARCHDHKFDPVPTRDYYSIQAVFATTQLAERNADFLPCENKEGFEEKKFLQQMRQGYLKKQKYLQEVLETNAGKWFAERLAAAKGEDRNEIVRQQKRWDQALATSKKRNGNNAYAATRFGLMKQGVPEEEYPPNFVGFTPEQHGLKRVVNKGLQRLSWVFDRYQPFALSVYNGHTQSLVRVQAPLRVPKDRTKGELESSCIRTNGDPFAEGEPVKPDSLSVIDSLISAEIPTDISGRRLAFARWVADARNPLTTRVIVNRVWQWHFGKAIAGNPNNFGSTGSPPTHPKLLDFLASTFVEDGWSIKKLHRQIMNSKAYRRSTQADDPTLLAELDPKGESWAVFHPRRLSAEELRDSMLAVSDELNKTLGGIPCRPEINQEVALQPRQVMGTFAAAWTPNPLPQQRNRRSIYVTKLRGVMHPMLEVFNTPAPDFSCEKREASTVTPQVFSLFNSQNTHSRALSLAARALKETDNDREAIRRCFELTLSRDPSPEEFDLFLGHWQRTEQALPKEPPAKTSPPLEVERRAVEENTGELFTFTERLYSNAEYVPDLQPADVDRHTRALSDICLVILNSNEFVYVY